MLRITTSPHLLMTRLESQVTAKVGDEKSLADWAESALFIENRRRLSRASLRGRLANSLFLEEEQLNFNLELLFREVSQRARLGPLSYPLVDPSANGSESISLRPGIDQAPYEFLLWLSTSDRFHEDTERSERGDIMFDHLVKVAALNYLGPGSEGVRFGHPARDDRPSGFEEAMEWLAGKLALPIGSLAVRPRRQDGGVDVAAWRHFLDGESAFMVLLCQCTVQDNWVPKASDIVVDVWKGWIAFGASPITALAIPHAVNRATDSWEEARYRVNIILDRYRLTELVDPGQVEHLAEMRSWTEAERALLGGFPPT